MADGEDQLEYKKRRLGFEPQTRFVRTRRIGILGILQRAKTVSSNKNLIGFEAIR